MHIVVQREQIAHEQRAYEESERQDIAVWHGFALQIYAVIET